MPIFCTWLNRVQFRLMSFHAAFFQYNGSSSFALVPRRVAIASALCLVHQVPALFNRACSTWR